jgi:glycosyltransferase involved in cell wall biosynthesis
MRILLVAPQPFFAERGTPIAVRLLAMTLTNMGHAVDLLVYPYGEDVRAPGLRVFRCRRIPFIENVRIGFSWAKVATDVALVCSLLNRARPGRYDVIHAVEEAVYPAVVLRRYHGAQVVYDMDSSLAEQLVELGPVAARLRWLFELFERWALSNADHVIAVSEALAARARAVRCAGSVHVIPDIPMPRADAPARDDLRALAGPGKRIALYVGNLEPYQGIDLVVEAAAHLPSDVNTVIVVVGGEGETLDQYRERVRRRRLDERLRFVGRRPLEQLDHLLAQADVLLSPRTTGSNTPLKIYSYMASGRPILATRLPPHTQVLDASTAELVAAEPEAYAAGLLRLLTNPAHGRRLAAAARSVVGREYSLQAYERRTAAAYSLI